MDVGMITSPGAGPGPRKGGSDEADAAAVPARDVASLVQLLDDHHLVVLGESAERRRRCADTLAARLEALPAATVSRLRPTTGVSRDVLGAVAEAVALDGACGRVVTPTVLGITESLRTPAADDTKRQYFLWEDAEACLEADPLAFGALVQGLLAVAAEHEFTGPDPLVLQRSIFFGGAKLGAYLEEEAGQFRSWREDDSAIEFADALAAVERPRVLAYRLDG